MKNLGKISAAIVLLSPAITFAATVDSLVTKIGTWINNIVPLLIGLGLAYFLWGVFGYIKAGSDDISKAASKQVMINGVIGLFVMVSVWGLVNLIQESLDIKGGNVTTPDVPI